jgi:flagellar biosynthesis protein FlhF
METHIYKPKRIKDAVDRIKEEIGPDAVILSTRRIPKDDDDPSGHDLFEVTAAPPLYPADLKPFDSEKINENPINHLLESDSQSWGGFLSPKASDYDGAEKRWNAITAELLSIKDLLFLINQASGLPDHLNMHPKCLNLYARLIKSGVSERHAQAFMKKGGAFTNSHEAGPEKTIKNVLKEILFNINVLNPFESETEKRHLAAFIGPTGVGKTTTLAKLAADLGLKQKKNVGLISIDSYRIGAVEQLKAYAAIMGLPCLPAFSSEELELAANKMRDKEIILIDTAGQSHLDNKRMKKLGNLLEGNLSISSHLVLSANAGKLDMKEAAENFAVLNPTTYVFTKLDEAMQRGNIIDQIMDLKLPISFVTNGQRVPEDIVCATKKNILKLILNQQ